MIAQTEYAERRKRLMRYMGSKGIAILPSAKAVHRNGDYEYPFRQNSDFYYLTGFEEPESVALLAPGHAKGEFVLFNRVRNREEEIWTGYRAGQEGAIKEFGANQAFPIQDLAEQLPHWLEGVEEIFYSLGVNRQFDDFLMTLLNKLRGKIRSGTQAPIAFIDISNALHEMRLIKSPAEIDIMRKAADITSKAHIRAMQACKPGVNEYQLEAELLYEFQRSGARYPAYTSIVGSGENSCILHYNNNNKVIEKNHIVLIDAGAELQNYAADVTRTFPASGQFSGEQKAIYDIVLEAQLAGIAAVFPGGLWSEPQDAIVKIITQGLIDLGILKGSLNDLIEQEAYVPFYMHRSGHWLGLDVHDVGRYKVDGKWRPFESGMVLTVEPGLYISQDQAEVDPRWHNIGVRIEDDILVTEQGHEVLSKMVPKTITEIEALMK